eukprot:Skav205327  [mRNA]  locus=scaffold3444:356763:359386:- [translate_table: standard]
MGNRGESQSSAAAFGGHKESLGKERYLDDLAEREVEVSKTAPFCEAGPLIDQAQKVNLGHFFITSLRWRDTCGSKSPRKLTAAKTKAGERNDEAVAEAMAYVRQLGSDQPSLA